MEGEATVIHVPVLCQYKAAGGRAWSSKQLIASKENEEEKGGKAAKGRRALPGAGRHLSIEHRHSSNILDFRRLSLTVFQERFERITAYVEQKKVKNEVYLGEPPPDSAIRSVLADYAKKVADLARGAVGRTVSGRWST